MAETGLLWEWAENSEKLRAFGVLWAILKKSTPTGNGVRLHRF